MKILITVLALFSMATLVSCTKVLYTHQQVMDSYKTKEQVLKQFGIPTEKRMSADTEEWLYRYELKPTMSKFVVSQLENVKTNDVTEFTIYKRYLVFAFDKQGNITGQRGEGVDLTHKVRDPGGTIALVIGGIALTALAIVAGTAMAQSSLTWY